MVKRAADSDSEPSKKQKRASKFQEKWIVELPVIGRSKKGLEHAYCKLCYVDVSISSGGKNDIARHFQTKQHTSKAAAASAVPRIKDAFKPPTADPVARVEVYFAAFVAEHNVSFSVADHFSDLVKVMFPDSSIAKQFRCKRTKLTRLITDVLAPKTERRVADLCQTNRYSIMMDESNDIGDKKCAAILVCVYDEAVLKVDTFFLALPVCNIGTGENLFGCLQEVLKDRNIPWRNMIGYSSDNAPVIIGKKNSVLSRIREKQPNVVDVGCVCHIISTCTHYGIKKITVPVEEVLQDVFHHFQHSSKRRQILQEFAVSKMKTLLQKHRFEQLSKLAFAALSLPHSNADPERCFSVLKKIQRTDRENLSEKSIQALLSLDFNSKTACYDTVISNEMCKPVF